MWSAQWKYEAASEKHMEKIFQQRGFAKASTSNCKKMLWAFGSLSYLKKDSILTGNLDTSKLEWEIK